MDPASISWSAFEDTGYEYASDIKYKADSTSLETVTIWKPSKVVSSNGIWHIYIHGGAWRDPLIRPTPSLAPTVRAYAKSPVGSDAEVAGFASIDYPLSAHPAHASDLPERNVKHPQHIDAVLTALNYLASAFGVKAYVLVGHSCGATLAFQTVMDQKALKTTVKLAVKPTAILGLNGLYDMPKLIAEPGEGHEKIQKIYRDFTVGAFTEDEHVWRAISPAYDNFEDLVGVKLVALSQSKADSLVPYWQTEEMLAVLKQYSGDAKVEEFTCTGDHNVIWQEGNELSVMLLDITNTLTA